MSYMFYVRSIYFHIRIEDTEQFISAHMDSLRNDLLKASLLLEIGGFIMGFGAVVGGIFGMNLKNHIPIKIYGTFLLSLSWTPFSRNFSASQIC